MKEDWGDTGLVRGEGGGKAEEARRAVEEA